MKLRLKSKTAGEAWLRSVPIALLLPVPVWMISEIITGTSSEMLNSLFFTILGIAMAVHLCAYAICGLPMFFRFYKRPDARIWDLRIAILVGATLGIAGICLTFYFFNYPDSVYRNPLIYVSGAGYGIATALSAFLARPSSDD